jgi:hypothetical protein
MRGGSEESIPFTAISMLTVLAAKPGMADSAMQASRRQRSRLNLLAAGGVPFGARFFF